MTYQTMALSEPGIQGSKAVLPAWRTSSGALTDKLVWMFRQGEGVGWTIALALNVFAAGWIGVAIWAFIFAFSIMLETAAEPIELGD